MNMTIEEYKLFASKFNNVYEYIQELIKWMEVTDRDNLIHGGYYSRCPELDFDKNYIYAECEESFYGGDRDTYYYKFESKALTDTDSWKDDFIKKIECEEIKNEEKRLAKLKADKEAKAASIELMRKQVEEYDNAHNHK